MRYICAILAFLFWMAFTLFGQSSHSNFSAYIKTADDIYFSHFAATNTDGATYTFTRIDAVVGTAAVDDGSGTCGTNIRVSGVRTAGFSQSLFIPAGTSGPVFLTLSPSFPISGMVFISAAQVGTCTSPAGDINVTAKYTY